MTPDMKRLCEAAQFAYEGEEETSIILYDTQAEAIVRAVLMVLREPSEDVVEEGSYTYDATGLEQIGPRVAARAFSAMLDAILAEPAKA